MKEALKVAGCFDTTKKAYIRRPNLLDINTKNRCMADNTFHMPKLVGLTGGIGSGKSTVAKLFEELGIPVFYSDEEAKKVYEDVHIQQQLNQALSENLFPYGKLNRERLSEIIFNAPEKRETVNAIVHPEVRNRFAAFYQAHVQAPYIINEAAILFETGVYKNFQKNILVTAPAEVRIERVMQRDHVTREQVLKRMEAQWADEEKIPLADYVIENTDLKSMKARVQSLHETLSSK